MDTKTNSNELVTPAELLAFVNDKGRMENDFLGFQTEALAVFCPEALENPSEAKPLTRENVIAEMRRYMDFAFEKALKHRGISANRSVVKMMAWLWLLKDEELIKFADQEENYTMYGVPILKAIAEKYDFPIPNNIKNWIDGEKCTPNCQEGC